jgi:uncharacterized protein YbjT (DUF2867 family)
MNNKTTVMVTGATGKQGGAVTRALLRRGYSVVALTRNPASKAAIKFHNDGVRIVVGDMTIPDSLPGAMTDIDVIFAMSTPFQSDHDSEVAQGVNVTDAANAAGVRHIVFSSVASANKNTGIPHFDTKHKIEQHIAASGIPYTIIGPTAFMENFIQIQSIEGLKGGKLRRALPASRPVQLIAVEDIGAFAVFAIEHPQFFLNKRIDIAGDELTGEQTAAMLSRAIGREITYEEFSPEVLKSRSPDLAKMMEWQAKNNYTADISGLRKNFPEVKWHSFEEWAKEVEWKTLLSP